MVDTDLGRSPSALEVDLRRIAMATRSTARSTRLIATIITVFAVLTLIGGLWLGISIEHALNVANSPIVP